MNPSRRDIVRRVEALDDDPTTRYQSAFMADVDGVEFVDPDAVGIKQEYVNEPQ